MSRYRQITAITVVSASLFYVWYRYCRKKTKCQVMSKPAVTQMALGSLLCCGANPFRKRKKTKGKGKAPYTKLHNLNDVKTTGPMSAVEPCIQPNIVAPIHTVTPVHLGGAPSEVHLHAVAQAYESVPEEILVFTAENPVKIDPVVTLGTTHENSLETVQLTNPEIQFDAPKDIDTEKKKELGSNEIDPETTPLVNYLSSSRENIRSESQECGPDLAFSCIEEPVQINEEESQVHITEANAQNYGSCISDIGTGRISDENPAVEAERPFLNFGFLNPDYRGLRPAKTGMFDDPENQIEEVNPEYIDGVWIPKVLIPHEFLFNGVDPNMYIRNFDVPAYMSGVIIGRSGKNVTDLKKQFNADISLSPHETDQFYLTLKVCCPKENKDEVVNWILRRIRSKPSLTAIGNPNQLQRTLPLGQLTHVYVRSMYIHKQMYITILDSIYDDFMKMQEEMSADYENLSTPRMSLYEPVTLGTIAVLKTGTFYSRIVIVRVIDKCTPKEAICFLLDHGTFCIASLANLRKIRAKYMQIPFQAVQVSWAHATPNFFDAPDLHFLNTFFTGKQLYAYPVRMESCCRADVIFLEKVDTENGSHYVDVLDKASRANMYHAVSKILNIPEQLELNKSDKPYYFCPYSNSYDSLVFYYYSSSQRIVCAENDPNPASRTSNQHEQQRQQGQLFDLQQQQRKSANQKNRQRAQNNPNGDATAAVNGGRSKRPQSRHNGRRGRKNTVNGNRQQNQRKAPHPQQPKSGQNPPISGSVKT